MSSSGEPSGTPKPVLKDKNPHNYRKVGYSMIIISVSLVAIALLSWNLADNYHFSSNIMALQEVDAMTPKSGYNVVLFDLSQPVGAKLKLLDHADSLDAALPLKSQDEQQNNASSTQVLLFNGSKDYNLNLMSNAEVYIQTPKSGYNVILDNYPLAVGAKLTLASHEKSYKNATDYENQQQDQIKGQEVKILIFTPNFTDNLKMVTGSSTPVGVYAMLANVPVTESDNQTEENQTLSTAIANSTSAVTTQSTTMSNQTNGISSNQSSTVASNMTLPAKTNSTASVSSNQSGTSTQLKMNTTTTMMGSTASANQTQASQKSNATTNSGIAGQVSIVISNGASSTKGVCNTTDCFNPQTVDISVGQSVTWNNDDSVGHTATSGKITDNQTGTVFDSGLIDSGKSYVSPPFKASGTYSYFCQVHPWMAGKIVVSETAPAPASDKGTGVTKSIVLNETVSVNANNK